MLRAGDLRHRGTIEAATQAPGPGGGTTDTWAPLATDPEVWFAREALSANERIAAMQAQANVTYKLRLRFRDDLNAGMRIVSEGKTYPFVSEPVDPDGRRIALEILVGGD